MVKWRRPSTSSFSPTPSSRRATLNAGKENARHLLESGRSQEALAVLESLVPDFPDDTELLVMLGIAHVELGDTDTALTYYETAYARDKNPGIAFTLALAYLDMEMFGSALYAFNEGVRGDLQPPDEIQAMIAQLRQDVGAMATDAGLPLNKAIGGLRDMERGTRFLNRGEFTRAIEANRAAIKILGDWPAPHNNLALALFFDGQVPSAIAECRQVLKRDPDNLNAAANLVRFLACSSDRDAAQTFWQGLRTRIPIDLPADALKLAEAAGIIEDDETVRRALQPLADWTPEAIGNWRSYVQVQQFLATADANLGYPKAAKRRLRDLKHDDPRLQAIRAALRNGQPGVGQATRFSYFFSRDMMSGAAMEEFLKLTEAAIENREPQAVKALNRFTARFPQLVVMAEKAIWEEDAVDPGLMILRHVNTPAAHAVLRRFAGSQLGSDEQRIHALLSLQTTGGVKPGEVLRIWRDGAWEETELRSFTIGPQHDRPQYRGKAKKLMEEALTALQDKQWAVAIALLREMLTLEPRACDAMNNLASALAMTGDKEAGIAVLERALIVNPTYIYARVNLALNLLDQDVDAAAVCLQPLEPLTSFTPDEFVFYQYGLAQVAVARKQYADARSHLDLAIAIDPEYELATRLLAHLSNLEFLDQASDAWQKWGERAAANDARHRRQQQSKLASLSPTVGDAVGIYSAEVLRVMARELAPAKSLTGLRKADLLRLVTEILLDPTSTDTVVRQRLSDTEFAALTAVLAAGGAIPQQQFRDTYGDDTVESPWWQYKRPESVAGRLRLHGLLVETTVEGTVYLAIPLELRAPLQSALHHS